ncbi:hypothetical protein HNO89_001793 [Sporosarcina luteola]|nr:hypothetical protein [Sporosarcina luteola]
MKIARLVFVGIAYVLGNLVGFITFMLQTLMLSGNPVSFTATEALVIHVLYFVSTLLLICGVISTPSRAGYGVALLLFTAVFLFHIQVFDRRMFHAGYDPALIQLQLAPVLHLGFVLIVAFFMMILQWRRQRMVGKQNIELLANSQSS